MNIINQLEIIKNKCPLISNHGSNRYLRHNFFEHIDTEIQAYLLGFYAADGSINEKRKTLRIQLKSNDIATVELYQLWISPNAYKRVIKEHISKGRNNQAVIAHEAISLDIASSKLCTDLVNLGFGYHKSYSELHLPNINSDLMKHFIRGYFDGDGCITGGICKEKGKKDRFRYAFDICAKTDSLLKEILLWFKKSDIHVNINYIQRDDMYRLHTTNKTECKKIFNILYSDSNFFMSRKFNKFSHYVNTEVTQLIAEYCNALLVSVNDSNNPTKSVEHPTKLDEDVR